jgi:hypothetical protein
MLSPALAAVAAAGAPLVRTGALGRAHPSGLWESPLATVTEEEAQAGAMAAAAAGGAPDINRERQTAEDVAAADPLSGLLKMNLLQRCRWGPVHPLLPEGRCCLEAGAAAAGTGLCVPACSGP